MPLGVCRSSGSRVRLPTRTTRLMLAMLYSSSSSSERVFVAAYSGSRDGRVGFAARRRLAARLGSTAGSARRHGSLAAAGGRLGAGAAGAVARRDPARRQVAHDAVGDLEDPRQLVEGLRLGVELEQVVDPVGLLVDLEREPALAPRIVADPGAAALLDQLADAHDDLLLPLLGQVGIEHEQNLVIVLQPIPPSVWSAPPGLRCGAGVARQSSIDGWTGDSRGSERRSARSRCGGGGGAAASPRAETDPADVAAREARGVAAPSASREPFRTARRRCDEADLDARRRSVHERRPRPDGRASRRIGVDERG